MSKSLSNGTLSLRFMQNAQRAKQQAQVQAEQAKVKDEAEWEISPEIKRAWGMEASGSRSSAVVTHEASYLPFLFSAPPDVGDSSQTGSNDVARPKGRRTFNERGQEVQISPNIQNEDEAAPAADGAESGAGRNQPPKRIKSISGFKSPLATKQKDPKRTKTAQQLIRETGGAEQLSSSLRSPHSNARLGTGFLKPSGVDSPSSRGDTVQTKVGSALKRERELSNSIGSEGKKRRKKQEMP